MIKKLMRTFFPLLVDILFVLCLVLVVITGVFAMVSASFLQGLSVLIGGTAMLILSFGGIYLLMDIRDGVMKKD